MTIDEEIAYLESELSDTRAKITKVKHLKAIEEGSSQSRFSAQYTSLRDLRQDEYDIKTRLNTLKGYSE